MTSEQSPLYPADPQVLFTHEEPAPGYNYCHYQMALLWGNYCFIRSGRSAQPVTDFISLSLLSAQLHKRSVVIELKNVCRNVYFLCNKFATNCSDLLENHEDC
ncbi:uncharacterized protein KZ484_016900 [Pholidichthys leucotaenia]